MFRVALHRRGGHGSEALDASGTFLGVCSGRWEMKWRRLMLRGWLAFFGTLGGLVKDGVFPLVFPMTLMN